MTYRALKVWQRNFDVFRRTWRSQIAWSVVDPFMWFMSLGLGLGGFVALGGDRRYIDFLAPGLMAGAALFSSGTEGAWATFARLEFQHTFDAMIVTPLSPEDVIGGEVLWAATRSIESGLALVTVMLLFGVQFSPLTLLAFPVLLLQGILVASAAVWTSSRVANIGQLNHFATLFLSPQFMFAGVFFPLDSLPVWAQAVAWLLPLSHSVIVVRSLALGAPDWETLAHLAWLCVVGTILFLMALRSMRARLVK